MNKGRTYPFGAVGPLMTVDRRTLVEVFAWADRDSGWPGPGKFTNDLGSGYVVVGPGATVGDFQLGPTKTDNGNDGYRVHGFTRWEPKIREGGAMAGTSKIVAGTVNDLGQVVNRDPTTFKVERPPGQITGRYEIHFTSNTFTTISSVVATQVSHFPNGDTRDNAVVVDFDVNLARIITGKSDGSLENRPFSFIAIGD